MDSIIKGGDIVTAVDNQTADIGIEDGKIRLIGKDLPPEKGPYLSVLMPILSSLTRKKKLL